MTSVSASAGPVSRFFYIYGVLSLDRNVFANKDFNQNAGGHRVGILYSLRTGAATFDRNSLKDLIFRTGSRLALILLVNLNI